MKTTKKALRNYRKTLAISMATPAGHIIFFLVYAVYSYAFISILRICLLQHVH
jgi:hypothetical protein